MTRFDEMKFSLTKELSNPAREVIWLVCDARKTRYDPVNQLVGYIRRPTITTVKNARSLIKRVERRTVRRVREGHIENLKASGVGALVLPDYMVFAPAACYNKAALVRFFLRLWVISNRNAGNNNKGGCYEENHGDRYRESASASQCLTATAAGRRDVLWRIGEGDAAYIARR